MIKKLVFTLILVILPWLAHADLSAHGLYLGAQGGYADPDNDHADKVWNAIRPFLGFRFNDHFALEAGYNFFNHKSDSKIHGPDLIGKAIVPFPHDFSFFIEAGLAYIKEDIENYKDKNNTMPVVGMGIGYNFTKNFAADISWKHLPKAFGGEIHNIDFASLGLSVAF